MLESDSTLSKLEEASAVSVTDPDFNPSGSDVVRSIKEKANELAAFIEHNVPAGRRRAVALTQLETATMWAVKASVCGDR